MLLFHSTLLWALATPLLFQCRNIESFKLEKASRTIKSNLWVIPTLSTRPEPWVPHHIDIAWVLCPQGHRSLAQSEFFFFWTQNADFSNSNFSEQCKATTQWPQLQAERVCVKTSPRGSLGTDPHRSGESSSLEASSWTRHGHPHHADGPAASLILRGQWRQRW